MPGRPGRVVPPRRGRGLARESRRVGLAPPQGERGEGISVPLGRTGARTGRAVPTVRENRIVAPTPGRPGRSVPPRQGRGPVRGEPGQVGRVFQRKIVPAVPGETIGVPDVPRPPRGVRIGKAPGIAGRGPVDPSDPEARGAKDVPRDRTLRVVGTMRAGEAPGRREVSLVPPVRGRDVPPEAGTRGGIPREGGVPHTLRLAGKPGRRTERFGPDLRTSEVGTGLLRRSGRGRGRCGGHRERDPLFRRSLALQWQSQGDSNPCFRAENPTS